MRAAVHLLLLLFAAPTACGCAEQRSGSPAGRSNTKETTGMCYTCEPRPRPDGLTEAEYRLRLPATAAEGGPVRGVVCISAYFTEPIFDDARWRRWAEGQRFALLVHRTEKPKIEGVTNVAADADGLAALLSALEHFSVEADRPELARVGLVHVGISKSAHQASMYAQLCPERTIAVVGYHTAANWRRSQYDIDPGGPGSTVPQLLLIGGADDLIPAESILAFVRAGRAVGAPWASCHQGRVVHDKLGDPGFILEWLTAVVEQRVPPPEEDTPPWELGLMDLSAGRLGRLRWHDTGAPPEPAGAEVYAPEAYPADPAEAHWLPDEPTAHAWRAYCLREDARDPGRPEDAPAQSP
jgi:hypothetical protein